MSEYYTEKYADIHFVCGERSGNANAAVLRYANRRRRVPPGTQNILILDAGSEGLGIRLHCRGGNYDLHI
jgi:hypothetical protein